MPTIDITVDAAQTARIQTAWQSRFGFSPAQEDIRQWMIERLRDFVLFEERKIAEEAIINTIAPFDPT